jgi:hypothetical protein
MCRKSVDERHAAGAVKAVQYPCVGWDDIFVKRNFSIHVYFERFLIDLESPLQRSHGRFLKNAEYEDDDNET